MASLNFSVSDNFSVRLAIAIARSGKSKGDLASHCGVALSTVSRWMKGALPKPNTLARIAEFLGVGVFWLLGEPKDKPEAKYQFDLLIRAAGAGMRSDARKREVERRNRALAMETADEFMDRMQSFTEVAQAYMGRCKSLCEAIEKAAPDEPITADLKTMASELSIHWPEMIDLLHDVLTEAVSLRLFAESSPAMMKILRSV